MAGSIFDAPELDQLFGIYAAALEKAGLDERGRRRLIEKRPELHVGLKKLFGELSLPPSQWDGNRNYPDGYEGPLPIREQVEFFAKEFSLEVDGTMRYIDQELPRQRRQEKAEGYFAFPSVEAVAARHFPKIKDPAMQYCRAILLIVERIRRVRPLITHQIVATTPSMLRQHARTVEMLGRVQQVQTGSILVLQAQFGLAYPDGLVSYARDFFAGNEFGLGAFASLCMVACHPKRFSQVSRLAVVCAGDEVAEEGDGNFSMSPSIGLGDQGLWFMEHEIDEPDTFGVVSAFLPD